MVTQVAVDEPDTAAKMPQPSTLVWIRRPGRRLSQGASPLNMFALSCVRNRISPIQMNNGRAVSANEECSSASLPAMISPTGVFVNSAIATTATMTSASATQMPIASVTSRMTARTMPMIAGSMRVYSCGPGWPSLSSASSNGM